MRYSAIPLSVIFLLTILCGSISSSGQNTLNNLGLTAATPSAVALSMRQLSSSYTGPVFRIRRSSDNELRDVYFDGSGTISLSSQVSAAGGGPATATTLGTWIGANSGTVAIWYDQSGFGRNASQPTFTFQPRIINAGVIEVANGKPSLVTDGIDDQLSFTNSSSNNFSTFVVARTSNTHQIDAESNSSTTGTSGQNYLLGATQSGTNGGQGLSVGTNGISNYEHGNSYMPPTAVYSGAVSGLSVIDVIYASKTPSVYLNSTLVRTGLTSPRPTVFASTQIGSGTYGAFNGNISEFVIFSSTVSSTVRQTIECNQSSFFIPTTITLGTISPIQFGSATANLSYSATTGSPTTYSITWSAGALSAGFANVTNAVLPTTPIVVSIGGSAAAGSTYTGNLTVNNACGTSSISYPISLSILNSILGLTPASTASYSLRKLSPSYTGAAVLVRRSSDNTTQNIGFLASGQLDTTALKTFVGAGNGFVNTWYDQSGNSIDAIQATLANQPRIVNAGTIERQNGVPSLYFTGSSFLTHNSFPITGFSGFSANVVAKWTTVGTGVGNIQTLLDNNHTGSQGFVIQDRPDLTARPITFGIAATPSGAGIQDNTFTGNGSSRILTFTANNTTVSGFRDGNALTTASISSTNYINQTRFVIGAWFNNGSIARYTTGNIPEVILFPSTLSNANRITLECNQSAYYGISLAGATNTEFYIQGTPASSACNTTDEQVVWKTSDLVNKSSDW